MIILFNFAVLVFFIYQIIKELWFDQKYIRNLFITNPENKNIIFLMIRYFFECCLLVLIIYLFVMNICVPLFSYSEIWALTEICEFVNKLQKLLMSWKDYFWPEPDKLIISRSMITKDGHTLLILEAECKAYHYTYINRNNEYIYEELIQYKR